MKRVRVYREGTPATDGRLIPRGGVTFETVIPVMERDASVLGMLSSLRREGDGWVTGLSSVTLPPKTALAANIIVDKGGTLDNITGRLVSATLTNTPVWPGMFP